MIHNKYVILGKILGTDVIIICFFKPSVHIYMHSYRSFILYGIVVMYVYAYRIPYMNTTTHENNKNDKKIWNLFRKVILILFLFSLGQTLFKITAVELQ